MNVWDGNDCVVTLPDHNISYDVKTLRVSEREANGVLLMLR